MPFSFFNKKPPARPPASGRPRPAGAHAAKEKSHAPERAQRHGAEAPLPSLDLAAPSQAAAAPVREDAGQVHPVVEEVAILYANADDARAAEVLERAIGDEDGAAGREEAWFLLFDLYQFAGRRDAFEAKAVEYAVRFGKSPPTWSAAPPSQARDTGSATPIVVLGPGFDGAGARQLDMLARMAQKNERVRADLGKLKTVDEPGCARLVELLHAAKRQGREIVLQNAASLASLLEGRIETGRREEQSAWLLLLELYQQQGLHEKFEECAVNYAVTFEVSPPSWEVIRRAPPPPVRKAPVQDHSAGAYVLTGELSGASPAVLRELSAWAAAHDPVVIDLKGLRRMDFVCAGTFLNTLGELKAAGRSVLIRGANHLVGGLLRVLGIDQVASLERGKGG